MELLPSCEAGDTKGWHKVGTICRRCGSEVRPIISATEPNAMNNEQHSSLSFTRVEVSGPDAEELIQGLPAEIKDQLEDDERTRHLTQLLGIALRDILPYAEAEVEYLDENRDGTPDTEQEYDVATVHLSRAQQALNTLNTTSLKVENVPSDAYDEEFQISFDSEE